MSPSAKTLPRSVAKHLCLCAILLFAASARADLRFAQPAIDAGQVRGGPALVKRFAFRNDGDQPIEITDTRAGCGCLKPRLPKRQFAPGEEGWMDVEINTLTQPTGPNQWRVQVFYRDGERPRQTVLQVNALLIKEVIVEPAALNIVTEQGIAHEIIVTDLRPKSLSVTAVSSSSPPLRCRLDGTRSDPAGRPVHAIHLEIGPDYPEGRHEEIVSIYTDDPEYRELRVPVTVTKRAKKRIAALPNEIAWTSPPGEPIPSRIVLLRDAQGEAVIVEKVTIDDPALQCHWAAGPGSMATVKVQVDAAQLQGRAVKSVLRVQIRQPVPQTIEVPVRINGER